MHRTNLELQSIQSMLVAGHRSVRLERHTLLLIGAVGGFTTGFTESLITAERFPEPTQRAVALLVWLSAWLGAMCVVDHLLTRRAREGRDETLPFAQAQITRAWWMLLAMGTLGSFAMSFYGGGRMIYALWIVLVGLGIYLFGLFSRPLIEWIGLATMLLGVTGLAAGLRYDTLHWLAASCFAIGMPLAGWLDARCVDASWARRALALVGWTAVVAGVPLLASRLFPGVAPPVATAGSSADPAVSGRGERVVRLAAGTPVTLRLELAGPLLRAAPGSRMTMLLNEPVDIVLDDGVPDGRFRVGEEAWHSMREGDVDLMVDKLAARLENGTAVVDAHAVLGGQMAKASAR